MRRIKWIFSILLLLAVAIFVFENAALVEYRFLGMIVETRRSVVVGVSILVGLMLGWMIGTTRRRN